MEIIIIAAIHAAITYTFSRLVKSEGHCIAFTWLNVFIACWTGNILFSGIDIAAVFVGGIMGHLHKKKSEENKITTNSIKIENITKEENAKIEANQEKKEPVYKPDDPKHAERVMPYSQPNYTPDAVQAKKLIEEGELNLKRNNPSKAAECFEMAITFDWPNCDPNTPPRYYDLRARAYRCLDITGPRDSLEEYRRAMRAQRTGRYETAIEAYLSASKYDPKFLWGHNNIAWMLATCTANKVRNGHEAIRHATIACEHSDWNCWCFIDTLAAAYAEIGNFEEALGLLERAKSVATPKYLPEIESHAKSFGLMRPIRVDFTPPNH